jgi:DNA-binding MarR family transcriptional regulator
VSTTDELPIADHIGSQLVRLVRLIERVQAQYQAEYPDAVDRATYLLLVHLVKDGPRRAGALAEAVHSDPSTVSRQVAHLVQLGLVERVADPADGRATLLVATDEGRRVFDENRQLRNRSLAAMMSDWPDADRTAFARLLTRFTDGFECHKARTAPPRS